MKRTFEYFIEDGNIQQLESKRPKRVITTTLLYPQAQQCLASMYNNPLVSDFKVHLKQSQETIYAHSVVLVANSEYFRAMITLPTLESKEREISIDDLTMEKTAKLVIKILYTGVLEDINESNIIDIMVFCNEYCLEELRNSCETYLLDHINPDNCFIIAQLDNQIFETLVQNAKQYIRMNITEALSGTSVSYLSFEALLNMITHFQYNISYTSASAAIKQWVDADPDRKSERIKLLRLLIQHPVKNMEQHEVISDIDHFILNEVDEDSTRGTLAKELIQLAATRFISSSNIIKSNSLQYFNEENILELIEKHSWPETAVDLPKVISQWLERNPDRKQDAFSFIRKMSEHMTGEPEPYISDLTRLFIHMTMGISTCCSLSKHFRILRNTLEQSKIYIIQTELLAFFDRKKKVFTCEQLFIIQVCFGIVEHEVSVRTSNTILEKLLRILNANDSQCPLPNINRANYKSIVHFLFGYYYISNLDYDKALSHHKEALQEAPLAQSFGSIGFLTSSVQKDDKAAIEEYTKGINLDPFNVILHGMRAASYRLLGDFKMAAEDFKKAVELEPTNKHASNWKTWLDRCMTKLHEAELEQHGTTL
jgi:tetratricopeptide (TPR) repeat protein